MLPPARGHARREELGNEATESTLGLLYVVIQIPVVHISIVELCIST